MRFRRLLFILLILIPVSGISDESVTDSAIENQQRARPDLFEDSLFGNEPVYFLLGSDPIHSKFQLSFKYRFLNMEESSSSRWNKLENLYFFNR